MVLTTLSIANRFYSQTGIDPRLTYTNRVDFRFIAVKAWNLTGTRIQMDAAPLDRRPLITDSTELHGIALQSIGDNPGRNHYARVGYLWPTSHRNYTFRIPQESETGGILAQFYDFPGQLAFYVQVECLWRSAGVAYGGSDARDIMECPEPPLGKTVPEQSEDSAPPSRRNS